MRIFKFSLMVLLGAACINSFASNFTSPVRPQRGSSLTSLNVSPQRRGSVSIPNQPELEYLKKLPKELDAFEQWWNSVSSPMPSKPPMSGEFPMSSELMNKEESELSNPHEISSSVIILLKHMIEEVLEHGPIFETVENLYKMTATLSLGAGQHIKLSDEAFGALAEVMLTENQISNLAVILSRLNKVKIRMEQNRSVFSNNRTPVAAKINMFSKKAKMRRISGSLSEPLGAVSLDSYDQVKVEEFATAGGDDDLLSIIMRQRLGFFVPHPKFTVSTDPDLASYTPDEKIWDLICDSLLRLTLYYEWKVEDIIQQAATQKAMDEVQKIMAVNEPSSAN